MRILLDTVTFLWAVIGAPELSNDARELFEDPENEIYLSSVSTWEIAIKHSRQAAASRGAGKIYPDTAKAARH